MMDNFVSISGISDRNQLNSINRICREEYISSPIVIGLQASNKSINQGTKNPRQPRFIDLGDLSKEALGYGFVPAIHYYTRNNETILRDIERVVGLGLNPSLALLQLNTLPASPEVLRQIKEIGFGIIFKVAVSNKQSSQEGYAVWKGDGVQDVGSGDVGTLIEQIRERRDFIDYAMFDPSHGTNLDLDLDESSLAIRFGRGIMGSYDLNHLGLVYAGGINPTNVESMARSLLSFFVQYKISIDTESGVRGEDDQLDLGLVRDYLVNSRDLLP